MTINAMTHASRLALLVMIASPVVARAQIRASEVGTVSQVIDGTKITVEYSRPRSRGRETLFGTKAVHWDEVWTPGANWATTFETSRNVKLNGHAVPKGKYSVWFVVREKGDWTVVLEPKVRIFHMTPPDSSAVQVRFAATPQHVPFTDVLTFSVPEVRANGGTLAMQWERVKIPIDIEVEPSLAITMAESDAKPFVGTYEHTQSSRDGKGAVSTFTVTYENGTLKGQWEPNDSYMNKFALIRVAPDWFVPGIYDRNGVVYEVLRPDMLLEFSRTNGRVTGYDMREEDDKVFASGKRKP